MGRCKHHSASLQNDENRCMTVIAHGCRDQSDRAISTHKGMYPAGVQTLSQATGGSQTSVHPIPTHQPSPQHPWNPPLI
jgi:hypothetical protein